MSQGAFHDVPVAQLPAGIRAIRCERTGPSSVRAVVSIEGDVRPSARTDIVFILDVSATTRELVESGQMGSLAWKVLEYVNQFDDDGVDFFLASTVDGASAGAQAALAALAAGRAPTDPELAAAGGVVDAGQAATSDQIAAMLAVPSAQTGIAGVLAPAIRAARSKLKPKGRLFIQVITDANIVDVDAVIAEIADMSRLCEQSGNRAMYRMHILGIGDVNTDLLARLDEGLEEIAPVDIVASDVASALEDGVQRVFKEMRRSYLAVGDLGIVSVNNPALDVVGVGAARAEADDYEPGAFMLSPEQPAPDLEFDLEFKGEPVPVDVSLQIFAGQDERVFSFTIPVPR